jgi:transposase InsO family protein
MPWITATYMSQRFEFVVLATQADVNFRELCGRFGISRKTGYKWRKRYASSGAEGLVDRSRRPNASPQRCAAELAEKVVALRREHPSWGGRKLRRRLRDVGEGKVPAASTCTEIVRRADLLCPKCSAASVPWQRFERAQPNELWQADFKGHFPTQAGPRCHPLTVVDDHSRFNLVLAAAADETTLTVRQEFTRAFGQYGLPEAMLCDNGAPWGCRETQSGHTTLTVWLLRLGVRVLHGRPYHPQTQGKEERFHRTLNDDLISRHTWRDLEHCAEHFTRYRHVYNCERPHHSLDEATPISRYRPSVRSMPVVLPPIEYAGSDTVRRVHANGAFVFGNQTWHAGRAFGGLSLGLRPSAQADGQWQVFFCQHQLGTLDLQAPRQPKDVLRSIYPSKPSTSPQPSNR